MNNAFQLKTRNTRSIMVHVILALVPGTVLMTYWFGAGVIINIAVVTLVSLLCESLALALRQRPIAQALQDGSIVLAAWLLALCLPASLPFPELIVGAISMTVLGKHVFGGLGQNPFNPAMVGYAVLLISFPKTMTTWLNPAELSQSINASTDSFWWALKTANESSNIQWDTITQATPLDRLRGFERQNQTTDLLTLSPWPWNAINVAWLFGGLFLLARGIIRWHIPVAMLLTASAAHTLHYWLFPQYTLPPSSMMLSGAMMLGAFFIATDPVTAPSSQYARLIYGASIGLLTVALRGFSNYPEGIAFAVLLMNCSVPLLDRLFTLERSP